MPGQAWGVASITIGVVMAATPCPAAGDKPASSEGLPLTPDRRLELSLDEGTWLSFDVSPDGRGLVFDLLGDLYTLPIGGGEASSLTQGLAFDTQPVFSPDGRRIAFISDRSGAENLWVSDANGKNPRRLSDNSDKTTYSSPAWSSDSGAVFVSRRTEAMGVFELWLHYVDGGAGVRMTRGSTGAGQRRDERVNALGAVASPDGRYVYYAQKSGEQWDIEANHSWKIVRRDLGSGQTVPITNGPASTFRPQLSPDGRQLVYGARYDSQTGLRLRDLQTGDDRWLVFPVERDSQDGGYGQDTLPRYDFTPDGQALIVSIGGRPHRVEVASGITERLPFSVAATIDVGPYLPVQQGVETGPVRARIAQAPRQSPDGNSLAFSALTRLYIMDMSTEAVRSIATEGAPAFQPAWSPDGRWLAFVTWDAIKGGHVMRVRADGRQAQKVSGSAAFYSDPVWSRDGKSIFALHSSRYDRLRRVEEVTPVRLSKLVRFSLNSDSMETVSELGIGAQRPYFTEDPDRIYYTTPQGVASINTSGNDSRIHFKVEGAFPWNHRHEQSVPVEQVVLSPDRRWALTRSGDQLHLLRVPPTESDGPTFDLLAPPMTPYTQISEFGADYFSWADDGSEITWGLGATFYSRSFDGAGGLGNVRKHDVVVEAPRDIPDSALLLRGGTAITMRGDEVIENADILIRANLIVAIGRRDEVDVPSDITVRDVTGQYIVPGFVDTHAHWYEVRRDVLDTQAWSLLINLAYGVTSGLDVQAMDQDMFVYQDLIDAGMMIGPRAWSVGRGMFSDNEIKDREDVERLLLRYRDFYRTNNVKSYAIGNRRVRQWVVEASAKLGMMPTTEGMADTKLDTTHAIDGYAGNEHYMPTYPLYQDVVKVFGGTRIGYTPTMLISGGGPAAEDVFFASRAWHDDPKLKRFMPHSVIDSRTSPRQWLREDQHIYVQVARDARRIMQAGGRVGIGSHAELQGVAYHWEMQAFAAGGWTPREILNAATVTGADIIGRADAIGSLEAGKYADLLVLAENPLEDISNTESIQLVMKNGRLYNADSLNEVWPRQRPLPTLWVAEDVPAERISNNPDRQKQEVKNDSN